MKAKRFLLWIISLVASWGVTAYAQGGLDQRVAELGQQIAKEMTEYQKTTIAVVQFTDLDGNVTDFGKYLAEELITRLFQTKKFKVIERQLLNKIIAEQKLSLTGMIDPTSAKQLGKLLGVDAVCSGTITDLAQSLRVNARLINTETGEIFAVASTEIFKDESVMKLMAYSTTFSVITPIPKLAAPSKSVVQKVETNDFVFELQGCNLSGQTVTCYLVITNKAGDRNLGLSKSDSRMFDDFGKEYHPREAQIGDTDKENYLPWLINDIPVKSFISFDGVSPRASKISLLNIVTIKAVNIAGIDITKKDFNVQFRNIPITK